MSQRPTNLSQSNGLKTAQPSLREFLHYTSREHASGLDLAWCVVQVSLTGQGAKEMKVKSRKEKSDDAPLRSPEVVRVHKIVGQLMGVEKMISEHRTGPQILQQIQAAISGLTSLKVVILKSHLDECLEEAEQTGNNSRFIERALEIIRIQMRR